MTIYLLCPKPGDPSGGVWFLGRIAKLLNEIGHEAYIWTPDPFSVYWDANPVSTGLVKTKIQPGTGDVLIVPETLWPMAGRDGVRDIMMLQNYKWLNHGAYTGGEILVVSRYLANWVKRNLMVDPVGKITPYLDDDVWSPGPKQANRVLLLARHNSYHQKMKSSLELDGFTVEYVTEHLTQRQLSECFSRCEYLVHMVHPEGFPMICLEAMRSGTIVVGTTGGGGGEFMFGGETAMVVQDPENGRYGNPEHFIELIMEQMNILRADADLRSRLWTQAAEWSRRYTADATKLELKEIFG